MLTEKYKPRTIQELIQDKRTLQEVVRYLQFPAKSKPLLIHGKTGCGKTCSVYALAHDLNMEVIELNASDVKNKENVEKIIGGAVQQKSLFNASKLIFIDEVEGFLGNEDRGGIAELLRIMEGTSLPIIFTANDVSNEKIKEIRKKCALLKFEVSEKKVEEFLKAIAEKEFGSYDEGILQKIAENCQGDVRSAINDLEVMGANPVYAPENFYRERNGTMEESIKKILMGNSAQTSLSALDAVEEDTKEVFLYLEENIPSFYKGEDINRAWNILSKADVFYGRIRRWQHWRFLVYINNLLTAGISTSKTSPSSGNYRGKGNRLLAYWIAKRKYQKRDDICKKMASHMHQSFGKTLKETFPFFKFFINEQIVQELGLNEDEKEFLKSVQSKRLI